MTVLLTCKQRETAERRIQEDMATGSTFLSEDQFLCSICLDVFTEPVSIPCGHNFCKACITRHWAGKEQCQCPLCNEKFNKGLKLRVNTGFREVVEYFKKHHAIAANNSPVKPGQVPCDLCLGGKFKASKTCLVCLTSYCETHLEPHQRVAALKRHQLTDPVHNLEEKICKKHNRMLELFCREDLTHVCVLCTEHSDHDTVPLEEAHVDRRVQMKKTEAQDIKPKRGKKGKKIKMAVQAKIKGKDEAMANSSESNEVQAPHIWWFSNGGPQPFNKYYYLPEHLGFSEGRYYYEVETEGRTGWCLGVVTESTLRKRAFTASPRNGSWMIKLENNTHCIALQNFPVHFFLMRKPERVMVFVDYDNGLVSFYDADTTMLIYTFIGCKFKRKIFLFCGHTDDVSWTQRLQRKFQEMRARSKLPDILLGLLLFFLISILQN